MLLLFSGCGMTEEEQEALLDFEKDALEYYEDKYGTDVTVEKSSYVMTEGGLFPPTRTEDMYVVCSDDTTILLDASTDIISDNKESEEIIESLTKAFTTRLEGLGDAMDEGTFIIEEISFNNYDGTLDGSFFHTRLKEDIDKFIAREPIALDVEMFLLCNREDSWENMQKQVLEMLEQDFPLREQVELTVLSKSCYQVWKSGNSRYPGIDMLDCYATYELGQNPYSYIQHYVKLTDGVYVTSHEKDFILEEGDLTLTEAITAEELNQLIYEKYDALPVAAEENKDGSYMVPDKDHVNYYHIDAATPIYNIQFSDRIKEQCGEEFSCYLRFVPEEIGLTNSKKFFYYPVDELRDYYYAFAIHTTYADAEFATLNESDYYFIGSQTEQED